MGLIECTNFSKSTNMKRTYITGSREITISSATFKHEVIHPLRATHTMLATQRVIPHGTAMAYYLLLPIFEFLCLTAKVIKTQKGFLGSKETLLRIKAQFSILMHEWV